MYDSRVNTIGVTHVRIGFATPNCQLHLMNSHFISSRMPFRLNLASRTHKSSYFHAPFGTFECTANAEPNTGASSSIGIVVVAGHKTGVSRLSTKHGSVDVFRQQSHAATNVHNCSGAVGTA